MTMARNSKKKQELLRWILRSSPMCIYQLAKVAGRPYRRVYDEVRALAQAGIVSLHPIVQNHRRATLVVSNDLIYQRLLRLDDLYAARQEFIK